MNSDFPRILTLLRKEQGISQKKAAADLGISQGCPRHFCPITKKASASAGWILWCVWRTIITYPVIICWAKHRTGRAKSCMCRKRRRKTRTMVSPT